MPDLSLATASTTSTTSTAGSLLRALRSTFEQLETWLDHYSEHCRNPNYHESLNKDLKQFRQRFVNTRLLDHISRLFHQEMFDKSSLIRLEHTNFNYYFFGDVHGSISDMALMRRMFWRQPNNLTQNNHYIFLGDYVDRGIHGFEVFVYLMMLKIIYPNNFTLLRGNHEFMEMNTYSFLPELQFKFGLQEGKRFWLRFNGNFSLLPYAALVCDNMFCCHGGIPRHLRSMEQIEAIPKGLNDLEDGTIPFQLVWNDFYSRQAISALEIATEPRSFVPNFTRGAGFIIGRRAVERFLRRFQLSYIVRAHDFTACERTGYDHIEVSNGAVFTLFSNSSYTHEPINNTAYLFVSIEQENVEVFPLVRRQTSPMFFNRSEMMESNPDLIDMKAKDPYSDLETADSMIIVDELPPFHVAPVKSDESISTVMPFPMPTGKRRRRRRRKSR